MRHIDRTGRMTVEYYLKQSVRQIDSNTVSYQIVQMLIDMISSRNFRSFGKCGSIREESFVRYMRVSFHL